MEELEPQKSGISRRTVTKAMAWSVPAIAVATASPAFAISGEPPEVCAGEPYKTPGNNGCKAFSTGGVEVPVPKGFGFPLRITNNTGQDIYILADGFTTTIHYKDGGQPTTTVWPLVASIPALPNVLPDGQSVIIFVYFNDTDSGGYTGRVDLEIPWGHPEPGPDPYTDPSNHPPITLSFCVTSNQWHPQTSEQCVPVDSIGPVVGCSTDGPIIEPCRI